MARFGDRAAHPYQEFQRVPPPLPGYEHKRLKMVLSRLEHAFLSLGFAELKTDCLSPRRLLRPANNLLSRCSQAYSMSIGLLQVLRRTLTRHTRRA